MKGRIDLWRRKKDVLVKNVDLVKTAESIRILIIKVQSAEAVKTEGRETTEDNHKLNTIQKNTQFCNLKIELDYYRGG